MFVDIGGVLYNLQSTADNVFRHSVINNGIGSATGPDPQNPLRHLTTASLLDPALSSEIHP